MLAIFFLADRYLKFVAISAWPNNSKPIIGGLLNFNFIPNDKIAFSLPLSGIWLNASIVVIIGAILLYTIFNFKRLAKIEIFCLAGILLGALSNLVDRFQYGYVIDYLDLKWFTVFNLADALISVSTLILIIYLFKKKS